MTVLIPNSIALVKPLGKPLTALEIWLDAVGGDQFITDLAELSLADHYCAPLESEAPSVVYDHIEGPGGCGWTAREPGPRDGGAAANGEAPSALKIAQGYAARGWNPVPIPTQSKAPQGNAWQKRTAAENLKKFNGGAMNIGVMLGPTSHHLVDVDLDSPEAIAIAPYLMPPCKAMFGRASKRCSYMLYYADASCVINKAAEQFKDPGKPDDKTAMLLELRCGGGGKASQTVFPRSIHVSGESIEWESGYDGEPSAIDIRELLRGARETAAASLFARYWPSKGARHDDGALVLGGFLARLGMEPRHAELFCQAVAVGAGARESIEGNIRALRDAIKAHADGVNVCGYPKVEEVFGAKTAKRIAELLGYNSSGEAELYAERSPERSSDDRIDIYAPNTSSPITPVMLLLDKHLSTDELEPPMRDVMGMPVEVRVRKPIGNLYELASESSDIETRLAAPELPLLTPHDVTSLSILIERHIRFFRLAKKGELIELALDLGFVKHYLKYRDFDSPHCA